MKTRHLSQAMEGLTELDLEMGPTRLLGTCEDTELLFGGNSVDGGPGDVHASSKSPPFLVQAWLLSPKHWSSVTEPVFK